MDEKSLVNHVHHDNKVEDGALGEAKFSESEGILDPEDERLDYPRDVDMESHIGLRGVAAVWVCFPTFFFFGRRFKEQDGHGRMWARFMWRASEREREREKRERGV